MSKSSWVNRDHTLQNRCGRTPAMPGNISKGAGKCKSSRGPLSSTGAGTPTVIFDARRIDSAAALSYYKAFP